MDDGFTKLHNLQNKVYEVNPHLAKRKRIQRSNPTKAIRTFAELLA